MFRNMYIKAIKSKLRNRDNMLWTLLFPIMLSTLFYFAFTNLDSSQQFKEIPIAVVDNERYKEDIIFNKTLSSVSSEGDERLFDLQKVTNVEEADELLKKDEIMGYIYIDENIEAAVKEDGIEQTILKSFLDIYVQRKGVVEKLIINSNNSMRDIAGLFEDIIYTKEMSRTKNPPTDMVNYYYALLAMVCMYGCFQGLESICYLQANLSPLGARRTMSPVSRFRLVLYDLFGGITVHFMNMVVVVLYLKFILKISFGTNIFIVLFTCFIGSMVGVSMGAVVSITPKLKENAKSAILVAFSMLCCYLAGLMVTGVNYQVAKNAPVISMLNPAARITDAFYSLYSYDTFDRFIMNIIVLLIMSAVMFGITLFFVRRQRYESI